MPKFSGGIWRVVLHEDSDNYIIKSVEGVIAKIPRSVPLAHERHAADVRLITEAPRMYELLEKVLVSCPFVTETQKGLRQEIIHTLTNINNEKSDVYMITPKGWIPATPIEYEPPKPPLWAKPLIWLFDWYLKHRKETDKNETAENDV